MDKEQNNSVEAQIKEMQEKTKNIQGLHFDAEDGHWNVEYNYDLLIENTSELDEEEIRREVKRFLDRLDDLAYFGISLTYIYEKSRGQNANQKCYYYGFHTKHEKFRYEVYIPSDRLDKTNYPIDFIKYEWITEMCKKEEETARYYAAAEKLSKRIREYAKSHDVSKLPLSAEQVDRLSETLEQAFMIYENELLCDGTYAVTEKWLRNEFSNDEDPVLACLTYCLENGGFCDSDIYNNVLPF